MSESKPAIRQRDSDCRQWIRKQTTRGSAGEVAEVPLAEVTRSSFGLPSAGHQRNVQNPQGPWREQPGRSMRRPSVSRSEHFEVDGLRQVSSGQSRLTILPTPEYPAHGPAPSLRGTGQASPTCDPRVRIPGAAPCAGARAMSAADSRASPAAGG
jgi:hypothetical protein